MKADTSEKGLEALIVADMTGQVTTPAGLTWRLGEAGDFDRAWTVDLVQLRNFLATSQPSVATALELNADTPTRQKFLARLQGEISKRGVIDVLRRGIKHGPHAVMLFYGSPSEGNPKAVGC